MALATSLAWLTACEVDSDGVAEPPMTVGSSTGGSTSGTVAGSDASDGLDDTAEPPLEGPRKRRLTVHPAFAGVASGTTLLVVLDDTRIEYDATQPGGADLRFFGPEEGGAYPVQIERWDPGGRSFVWVRIDVTPLPDHVWMYYGDPQGFATIDPAAVWDGAFAAVWHMDRGASVTMPDTTANGHELTFIDFAGQLDVAGKVGLAAAFQPPAMLADAGPLQLSSADQLALSDAFTLEAWVSTAAMADDATHHVLRKAGAYELHTLEPASDRPKVVVHAAGVVGPQVAEDLGPLPPGQWTYLAATYRADDGTLSFYRNGMLTGTVTVGGDAMARTLAQSPAVVQVGRTFRGTIDEVRVSTIARSPEWIRLQHASMSEQLLTFGPPQPR